MDFKALRQKMVDEQIIARGIKDQGVIDSMRNIPRHEFVELLDQEHAYQDHPVSIGCDQTISQPYMVAIMSQALSLSSDECVLEVGTGSGYQTAILASMAKQVITIERFEELALKARNVLEGLGYSNIDYHIGDGTEGIKGFDHGFDAIIITAAAPSEMNHLLGLLKEGGRLLVPIGSRSSQTLTCFTKTKDELLKEEICQCVFVPLIGAYGFH